MNSDLEYILAALDKRARQIREDNPNLYPYTEACKKSSKYFALKLLEAKWTVKDIIAYLYLTEEVNPSLKEEVALKRMKLILDKYPRNI
jgi:hypothetical protein